MSSTVLTCLHRYWHVQPDSPARRTEPESTEQTYDPAGLINNHVNRSCAAFVGLQCQSWASPRFVYMCRERGTAPSVVGGLSSLIRDLGTQGVVMGELSSPLCNSSCGAPHYMKRAFHSLCYFPIGIHWFQKIKKVKKIPLHPNKLYV